MVYWIILLVLCLIYFSVSLHRLRFLIDTFIKINQRFYDSQVKIGSGTRTDLFRLNNLFINQKDLVKQFKELNDDLHKNITLLTNNINANKINKPNEYVEKAISKINLRLNDINKNVNKIEKVK
jgi:hypothetical protein